MAASHINKHIADEKLIKWIEQNILHPREQIRKWIPLPSVPQIPASNPPGCAQAGHQFIFMNCDKAIYRYDIITNDWEKWKEKNFWKGLKDCEAIYHSKYDVPLHHRHHHHHHLHHLHHHQLIHFNEYDFNEYDSAQGSVIAVIQDLNPKCPALNSWEIIRSESCESALFIEKYDEIHLFTGSSRHHFFCTKDIAQPDQWSSCYIPSQSFAASKYLWRHGVVFIPSQDRVLIFGGITKRSYVEACDVIREYDFRKQSWVILNRVTLPYKMYGFGYILTADERYIVIFGGGIQQEDGSGYVFTDEIFFIDLATMNIAQSRVKCPKKGMFTAISSLENNGKLVEGFIQRHAMECGLFIPSVVCDLINFYSREQYVHLMCYQQRHWKIDIKEIISNPVVYEDLDD